MPWLVFDIHWKLAYARMQFIWFRNSVQRQYLILMVPTSFQMFMGSATIGVIKILFVIYEVTSTAIMGNQRSLSGMEIYAILDV